MGIALQLALPWLKPGCFLSIGNFSVVLPLLMAPFSENVTAFGALKRDYMVIIGRLTAESYIDINPFPHDNTF